MAAHTHRALAWIAAFKLVKASLLLILAAAMLKLLTPGELDQFVDYLHHHFPLAQGLKPLAHLIDQVAGLTPHRIELIAGLAAAYACLYLTEGVGLWLRKRWAEYLTTIATASLIPFELYELVRGVTVGKALALAINVAIVIYLIWVLRVDRPGAAQARRAG